MAYAAVNSLLYTIDHLQNSSRISFASSATQKILDFALDFVKSLQGSLRKFDDIKNCSDGVMDADARIRDEARRLEDAIESHASAQFLSQFHNCSPPTLSLSLDELRQAIDCFAKTVDKMGGNYIDELQKPSTEEVSAVSSENYPGGNEGDMVGLSDLFLTIRNLLISNKTSARIAVCISGMAGIGKTRLAKKIFHDCLMKENFEFRAFVRVGRNYKLEEILRGVIAQVNLDNRGDLIMGLEGKKYLIVLDDVWDLRFYLDFKRAIPNDGNGSRILLTSRKNRPIERGVRNAYSFTMRLLNQEESWELLRMKVFGEEDCPHHLVKAGKKIAKNCEGLPLLIIVVAAQILGKGEMSREYWNEVAEKRNSVFENACDQISEVLIQSYMYLRQYLKLCFLYIGVFPQNCVVWRSRIVKLWRAEGFLEHSANNAIDKLVSHNLVLVCQQCYVRDRVHAYRLHPAYWHMCRREGDKNKFLCILNSYADCSIERLRSHRSFAIYNNVLFAIKEVHDSLASVSTARSLLCTGPYHKYEVPICLELGLLRVLDALTIRFYEFPDEVVNLIQLRYLALTCDSNLPRSIFKLWRLQYLIIHQHLSIKLSVDESYLPIEIWDLQELRNLQIMGRNLPDPPPSKVLPNLTKLLNVGVQSCSMRVLESVPNLRKLRIQIELEPDDIAGTMRCFDHISFLDKLESLQSVIVDPLLLCEPMVAPPPHPISTSCLKKLSLSGFGYAWEDMSKIADLPSLTVLKLKCYAFRGEKWEAKGKEFSSLGYLLIEDTDLVQWTAGDGAFPRLWRVTMKNCYNLEEIPLFSYPSIDIELVDCDPLAETCAKQRYDVERVSASYSWK